METIITAGKYSAATFEYAGIVSISYVKRSGCAVKRGGCAVISGVKKITSPVVNVVSKPFVHFKNKRVKALEEKHLKSIDKHAREHDELVKETIFQDSIVSETSLHDEKIRALEEKIVQIELKLAELQKYGVQISSTSNTNINEQKNIIKQQKILTNQKSALLQALVDENRALRDS